MADSASVRAGVDRTIADFGQLDILVNNAGFLKYTTFEDCREEDWDRIVDINMKGPFLCTQAAIPHMRARQTGAIVNMTSLAAKTGGLAAGPPYAAAKAGVLTLTIGMARYLAPDGIRVNAIAPGSIYFEGGVWGKAEVDNPALFQSILASIPGGRYGRPEEVAAVAVFLASDPGCWVTGQTIAVDGGQML